jgi:hypothetical protein
LFNQIHDKMEINLKELSTKEIQCTIEPRKMRLSDNASSMVFQMFTKNVYSNAIGTVVREIASNCFDSHAEAKVNLPVIIRKSIDANGAMYISFIDFGVGMSEERIYDIYGVYFESTKRDTNDQIGGFGIGGKTPFAYKRKTGSNDNEYDNNFYVITNYNKVRYSYMMMEGHESPEIVLLHTEPTTERNGTEVRIPILKRDLDSFKKEIVKQLYYFENIIFEGFEDNVENADDYDKIINANYQIVRSKSFLFRGNACESNVHICLGKVAYPLNFSNLGLRSADYNIPIALRFNVGELNVTMSRESLDYSNENHNELIKSRLNDAISEIKELLVSQYDIIDNLEDYFKVRANYGHLLMPNNVSVYVGDVIKQKEIGFKKFRYSTLTLPNDRELFHLFFDIKLYGRKPVKSYKRKSDDAKTLFGSHDEKGGYKHLMERDNLYSFEGIFERTALKQAYLKSEHPVRFYAISKKEINSYNKFIFKTNVADLFNVDDDIFDADGNPTEYMQTLLGLREEYWQIVKRQCPDYNALVVPEEYIAMRKSWRSASRQTITDEIKNTTIPVRFVAWSQYRVKLDSLFNIDCPIYYGTKDDDTLLKFANEMYGVFFNSNNIVTGYEERYDYFRNSGGYNGIMFIILSRENVKYMKFCKNAKHISMFKEEVMSYKEYLVTEYFQVQQFHSEYYKIHQLFRTPEFSKLSPYWASRIGEVTQYLDNFNSYKIELSHYYNQLSFYFNLRDIELTYKQQRFVDIVKEGLEMQEMNADTMEYLELYQNYSSVGESFWNILKKVLVY